MEKNPVERAAELVGSQSELARALSTEWKKLTPQAVQHWCRTGRVPAERVLAVEALTGGQVTRHELRPDLYPQEEAA